jgi:ABC-type multidrug transport system fused ATPase/permease subunit
VGWTATNDLRADLALHCLRLDMSFHKKRTPGEMIERIDGDVTALANFFSQIVLKLLGNAILITGNLTFASTNTLYVIGYTVGLALGAYLYSQKQVSIGTAYLIVFYIGMLSRPLESIREQVEDLQEATASIERVEELLQTRSKIQETARTALPAGKALVEFRGVSFSYDEQGHVLQDVSFQLQPGKVLGLLGRTGSGKTTLARLLFRLYYPGAGSILLDGVDIRNIAPGDLRDHLGMVTQDVQLFQASIRDNLTFFGKHSADDMIERVLQELGAGQWVQSLPDGLDTHLAAGGQALSAGEAQLLAFTRVFLKNPGLVILDEASSRLDPVTENLLERAMARLLRDRTGIIIAHRLRTVQRADEIMILEQGRVVEYGARASLANDPGSRFYSLLQTGLEEVLV